ncbi:MAG TPA: hypothetical protein VJ978_08725 [Nitriliruptoraceae bacterium]|nr:hypothetical protein [Nitriliruptoraceae bacterium]
MDVQQAWLLVGVPGLIVAAALFAGHDRLRALVGYAVLALVMATFLSIDGGALWGGLVGLIAVGLVATGRGSVEVDEQPEEQQVRDRWTHTA